MPLLAYPNPIEEDKFIVTTYWTTILQRVWHKKQKRGQNSPGGEGSKRCPKAGHAPLPSFPECLLHQLGFRGWVDSPKRAFSRLLLGAWDFNKVTVQREVVPNGILQGGEERARYYTAWK